MTIVTFPSKSASVDQRGASNGQPPGGEPPHNGGMDARVEKLENFAHETRDRLTRIETRIESMDKTVATKSELHDMKAELVKWIVGTAIGLGVAGIAVMTFVLNNAAPRQPSVSPQPIIITVPPAVAPPQAPTAK